MSRHRITPEGLSPPTDRSLKSGGDVHRAKEKKSLSTQPHRRKEPGDSVSFFGVGRHIVCPTESHISAGRASRVLLGGRSWMDKQRMTQQSGPRSRAAREQSKEARAFNGFYTPAEWVSNGKPHEGSGGFTGFTDFTANRKGGYVPLARAHSRPRSPAHPPTPPTKPVKPVKSVKPQDGRGRFSPPRCKMGCKFYTQAGLGVVA